MIDRLVQNLSIVLSLIAGEVDRRRRTRQTQKISDRLGDLRLGPSEEEIRERELDRILAEDDRKFPPSSGIDRRS